jgi:hypothetical protein
VAAISEALTVGYEETVAVADTSHYASSSS